MLSREDARLALEARPASGLRATAPPVKSLIASSLPDSGVLESSVDDAHAAAADEGRLFAALLALQAVFGMLDVWTQNTKPSLAGCTCSDLFRIRRP